MSPDPSSNTSGQFQLVTGLHQKATIHFQIKKLSCGLPLATSQQYTLLRSLVVKMPSPWLFGVRPLSIPSGSAICGGALPSTSHSNQGSGKFVSAAVRCDSPRAIVETPVTLQFGFCSGALPRHVGLNLRLTARGFPNLYFADEAFKDSLSG